MKESRFKTSDGRIIVTRGWKCSFCGKAFYRPSSAEHPTCSRVCKYKSPFFKRNGAANHQWKGGRTHDAYGYIIVRHPLTGLYVKEHRLMVEIFLGRNLRKTEQVHHRNGDKTDNRIENLEIVDKKAHSRLHAIERHKTAALFGGSR